MAKKKARPFPPISTLMVRRLPKSGIYGLPFAPEDSRVVIGPVPFEATTSYGGGTSKGPAAVLAASRQVDLFDHETGRPYAAGLAMLAIPRTVAAWKPRGQGSCGDGDRQGRAGRQEEPGRPTA